MFGSAGSSVFGGGGINIKSDSECRAKSSTHSGLFGSTNNVPVTSTSLFGNTNTSKMNKHIDGVISGTSAEAFGTKTDVGGYTITNPTGGGLLFGTPVNATGTNSTHSGGFKTPTDETKRGGFGNFRHEGNSFRQTNNASGTFCKLFYLIT